MSSLLVFASIHYLSLAQSVADFSFQIVLLLVLTFNPILHTVGLDNHALTLKRLHSKNIVLVKNPLLRISS
jgi:hypothetical protein